MSLAEDLHKVLDGAASVLRSRGVEDVATMAEQAAGILAAHIAGPEAIVAEDAAVRLIDHLFRGSAAAGAIQSMPPVPEVPAPVAEDAPAPEPAAVVEQVVQPPQPDPQPAPADVPAAPSIDLGTVGEPIAPTGWGPPPDPPAAV